MQSMKCYPLSCLVFLLTCFYVAPSWSTSLSFVPNSTTIEVGQTFNLGLWITDLEEGDDLGAFDFSVQYDPAILAFGNYTLGTGLGSGIDYFDLSLGPDGPGSINLAVVSLLTDLSLQENSFLLATLTFTGTMAGDSELSFSNIFLGDGWGEALGAASGLGHVTVNTPASTPVPEPSTTLLFGVGLILAALRLRKK